MITNSFCCVCNVQYIWGYQKTCNIYKEWIWFYTAWIGVWAHISQRCVICKTCISFLTWPDSDWCLSLQCTKVWLESAYNAPILVKKLGNLASKLLLTAEFCCFSSFFFSFFFSRDFKVAPMVFLVPLIWILMWSLILHETTMKSLISVRYLCIKWYTPLNSCWVQSQILLHIFAYGLSGKSFISLSLIDLSIRLFFSANVLCCSAWHTQNCQLFFMRKFFSLLGGEF